MVGEHKFINCDDQVSFRLINSKFPPETLFDDVADAEEFDALFEIQALTNPRIKNEVGDLNLLPMNEIPFGINGVNYVTAPFTHINPDGSRFSDGSFGILYLADTMETAIAETRYHQEKYFQKVTGLHYDSITMRGIKVTFSANVINATQIEELHYPDDYTPSRRYGFSLMSTKMAGVQYKSVRNNGAICWGLLSPRHVHSAIQSEHFEFVFDGKKISKVIKISLL